MINLNKQFLNLLQIENERIHFEKKFPYNSRQGVQRNIDLSQNYFIRFVPNRITYRACFQALDSIAQNLLGSYFADFLVAPENCIQRTCDQEKFEWFNQKIAANDEQITAIKNIVNCTAFPFPYVVFGPPGNSCSI